MIVGALADFNSHRIEGFTRLGNHQFSVPLFTQVAGLLWMGGNPVDVLPLEFDAAVNLYAHEAYRKQSHQLYLETRLYDEHAVPDERKLHLLANHVNACTEAGLRTLVHCQAGLNRSGLIAALALIKRGMNPADAIAKLRDLRCDAVLCNGAFEQWLLAQ